MRRIFSFLLTAFLTACAPRAATPVPTPTSLSSTPVEAHDALVEFFSLLHSKDYAAADTLYGGSYDLLQTCNPDVDPSEHALLWTRACEQNGLQCLPVRTAIFQELRGDSYVFQVEFSNPDGSMFVLGPCCGANETEMPPVSKFEYTVNRNAQGKFVIMETPPYVP